MRARHFLFARGCVATLALFIAQTPISFAHAPSNSQVTKAPPPKPIDWDKLTQEATDTLVKYIKINTTNPPGNELEAAKFLKEKFLSEGIAATTWEPDRGRAIAA